MAREIHESLKGLTGMSGTNKEILSEILSDDGLFLLKSYAMDGYSKGDIADIFGVSNVTFDKWCTKYPQIEEAMKQGKVLTDYKVENALLRSALGYKTKEVKTTTIMRFGKVVETQVEELEKDQAPNIQAITLWLCNRQKDKWNTPNSRNLLDEVEEDTSIQVTVTRANKNEVDVQSDDEDIEVNESVEITKAPEPEDYSDDADWADAIAEYGDDDEEF